MKDEAVIKPVKNWLETMVVGLNLCPFAKREMINNRIRFCVSQATNEEELLHDLQAELNLLNDDGDIETTLLIHPHVLTDFYDYNEFLDYADGLLVDMELDGVYQVASFHPDYQFAETQPEDAENFSNRSPYPLLHILREQSLENALASVDNPEAIPERNIELLNEMGSEKMRALFNSHFDNKD